MGLAAIAPSTIRRQGGGPGMVLRADVLAASLDAALEPSDPRPRLLMSPRGVPLTQQMVRDLAERSGVIIVCGRFEGVDERVIEGRNLQEVSIGDYILSGGEIAALTLLDACVRLLPGVMGKDESGVDESFEHGLLEYPHYTRPRDWEGRTIPEILHVGRSREDRALAARAGGKTDARTAPRSLDRNAKSLDHASAQSAMRSGPFRRNSSAGRARHS